MTIKTAYVGCGGGLIVAVDAQKQTAFTTDLGRKPNLATRAPHPCDVMCQLEPLRCRPVGWHSPCVYILRVHSGHSVLRVWINGSWLCHYYTRVRVNIANILRFRLVSWMTDMWTRDWQPLHSIQGHRIKYLLTVLMYLEKLTVVQLVTVHRRFLCSKEPVTESISHPHTQFLLVRVHFKHQTTKETWQITL